MRRLASSWRRIEERDGSGQVLRQYVWGARYIDNIVQIGVNTDPTDTNEQDCEDFYYPVQDANFNVMGLVDADGNLKERYEYTPYGERTVYTNAGSNDTLTSGPLSDSERVKVSTIDQAYSLCDLGHQGLFLDKEYGLYYNRHRDYHPRLGRWLCRDPVGYGDEMSLYAYGAGDPCGALDPWGLETIHVPSTVISYAGIAENLFVLPGLDVDVNYDVNCDSPEASKITKAELTKDSQGLLEKTKASSPLKKSLFRR